MNSLLLKLFKMLSCWGDLKGITDPMPFHLSRAGFETTDISLCWEGWKVLVCLVWSSYFRFGRRNEKNPGASGQTLVCSSGLELPQRQPNHVLFSGFILEGQWKSSLQCICEMNKLFSIKADMPKAGCTPSDLLADLDAVRDLSSGASKYRDFIRRLPIHLSKYILSMLGCIGDFLRDFPLQSSLKFPRFTFFFSFRYAW